MILDNLRHASLYRQFGPLFDLTFDYLKGFDLKTPDGRHDLQGDDLYMLVQTFESAPASERTFESHRRYADIQYIVQGREVIYYRPTPLLRFRSDYDPEKDVQFYEGDEDRPLHLEAGDFTVFWPQDGHKPGCLWTAPSQVRKVVAKIRIG